MDQKLIPKSVLKELKAMDFVQVKTEIIHGFRHRHREGNHPTIPLHTNSTPIHIAFLSTNNKIEISAGELVYSYDSVYGGHYYEIKGKSDSINQVFAWRKFEGLPLICVDCFHPFWANSDKLCSPLGVENAPVCNSCAADEDSKQ